MARRFFQSLEFKIGAAVLLVELVTLTLLGLFYIERFTSKLDAQLRQRMRLPGELMARNLMTFDSLADEPTMLELVGPGLEDWMLVGAAGNIFYAANSELVGHPIGTVRSVRPEWFSADQPAEVLRTVSDGTNSYMISITPISVVDGRTPYLYAFIKVKTTELEREKRALAGLFLIGSLVSVIATSGVIIGVFRLEIARRLRRILAALRRVESGDLGSRMEEPKENDELAQLQVRLNSMVRSLERQMIELKRAERKWATQYVLTRILAESNRLAEAAPKVLQTFCESLEWARGEFWIRNGGGGLECAAVWQNPPERAADPASTAAAVPLGLRSEMMEQAWSAGELRLSRQAAGTQAGMGNGGTPMHQSAFAYPIVVRQEVCGALFFSSADIGQSEKELGEVFRPIAAQIGQFLDRRRAEEALAKSEERFQLVARATNDTIWDWDLQQNHRWWSEGFHRLFGYRPDQVEPGIESWLSRVHPHDKTGLLAGIHSTIECGEQSWSNEYRFLRADGRYAFILDRGYILRDEHGKAIRMIGSMMDITSRKESEQELQRLSGRILEAQEEERGRVARELHDGVNQILSAAKFRLQLVEEKLTGPDRNALKNHTGKAIELLDKALQEVRLISNNLRPSELDDLGLMAAVRSACDEYRERAHLEVDLQVVNFPEVLVPEMELTIYRIVQEALANIEKHAQATRVVVRLAKESMMLLISVRDNGRGFPMPAAEDSGQRRGLGLVNMKERAAFLGGMVSVNPLPKRGVEVCVRIPLLPEPKESEVA